MGVNCVECAPFAVALADAARVTKESAGEQAQALMLQLIRLELLGRPQLSPEAPLWKIANSYRLKMVLSDIYTLLSRCLCLHQLGRRTRRKQGCQCRCCQLLYSIRQQHQFVGPAFRALYASLSQSGSSQESAEALEV